MFLRMQDFDFCPNLKKNLPNLRKFYPNLPKKICYGMRYAIVKQQ